jgi:PilZ domain
MAVCEVCGNDYDMSFDVVAAGARHTFDSLECAIHRMAPVCEHCGCTVIGHGVVVEGHFILLRPLRAARAPRRSGERLRLSGPLTRARSESTNDERSRRRPPRGAGEAEITLVGRGISVSSRVEFVGGGVLTVRPSVGDFAEQAVARVGDRVDVFWKGPEDTRSLPAEVLEVEQGTVVRWRLQIAGEAEVTQRRSAVRGRVTVPVEAGVGSSELKGETIDLSENGLRAAFEGFGMLPEPGTSVDLVVSLEDGPVRSKARVIRVQARGASWLMSIQFVNLDQRDQDRVRRRVFQALREERARRND